MLLSCSLNSALQKRKEYLDQLKAFKYFNSDVFENKKKPDKKRCEETQKWGCDSKCCEISEENLKISSEWRIFVPETKSNKFWVVSDLKFYGKMKNQCIPESVISSGSENKEKAENDVPETGYGKSGQQVCAGQDSDSGGFFIGAKFDHELAIKWVEFAEPSADHSSEDDRVQLQCLKEHEWVDVQQNVDEKIELPIPICLKICGCEFNEQILATNDQLKNALDKKEELGGIDYKDCLDYVDVEKTKWRTDQIKERWSNLHEAAHFVFVELVGHFQQLRETNEDELEADFSQYNDYHAIDMFSMHMENKGNPHANRLFLLYSLVYTTLNPNQQKNEFLQNFESYENYMEYLRDVNFADFVAIVPLLRVFFNVHDQELSQDHDGYWQKSTNKSENDTSKHHSKLSMRKARKETEISNIKNDLENLAEFFLRRSFLEEALDNGYNVYTAVNVYHLSFDLHQKFKQFYVKEGKSYAKWNEDKKKPQDSGCKLWRGKLWHFMRNTWFFEIFLGYERNEEEAEERLLKSCFEQAKLKAEVESSEERALVCFVFQSLLYFGCFLLSTSQSCYDDTGLLGRGMKDLICCVAIFFCYQFLTSVAISEFMVNSLTVFQSGTFKQKVIICINVLINSLFSLSLVYSSALVMKSSGSFTDTILNAIAVFFISELDDMLVTDLDAEILEERTVQAMIGIMMELSVNHNPGISHHLKEERHLIRFIGWYSLIFLLPYSYFTYFRFQETVSDLDC